MQPMPLLKAKASEPMNCLVLGTLYLVHQSVAHKRKALAIWRP